MATQKRFWLDKQKAHKKLSRITVAAPDHVEAWLNNHVRFLQGLNPDREFTRSSIVCDWIIEKIEEQQGVRKPACGIREIQEKWKAVKSAMDAAFEMIGRRTA